MDQVEREKMACPALCALLNAANALAPGVPKDIVDSAKPELEWAAELLSRNGYVLGAGGVWVLRETT